MRKIIDTVRVRGTTYELIENNSRIYCNGSVWESNRFGSLKIIGKSNKRYVKKNGDVSYKYYICKFTDGTIVEAIFDNIKSGEVKNPNASNVYNKGHIGQGKYNAKQNKKEYALWTRMLKRCYSQDFHNKFPSYTVCTVSSNWKDFNIFCEEIQKLNNYLKWKNDTNKKNNWELDKDIKIKGNKVYSLKTCLFVTAEENQACKKLNLTGLTYVAIRILDNYKEKFTNQTKFAKKWNLNNSGVNECVLNKRKIHKGWTFKIIKEV